MGPLWDYGGHFGATHGPLWVCGNTGGIWDHYGVTVGPLWDNCGLWDHYGTIVGLRGRLWDHVATSGPLCHYVATMGPLWGYGISVLRWGHYAITGLYVGAMRPF